MKAKLVSIKPVKNLRPRLIAMTGTPVSERPDNAYPLIKMIAPSLCTSKSKFADAFMEFEELYFGGTKIKKLVRYKNLEWLQDLLSTISIRRTLDNVQGMPEKIWITRNVELPTSQMSGYQALLKKEVKDVLTSKGVMNTTTITSLALRLRQYINNPHIIGIEKESAKYDELEQLLDELLEDDMQKVLVWTIFKTNSTDALCKRFAKYKPISIDGDTTDEDIIRWNHDFDRSENRVVFATPQKGGTGLDFLSRCRTAIYLDIPWSLVQFKQSQDRIVRRTNTQSTDPIERLKGSPATLISLHAQGTVDDLVWETIQRKLAMANSVTESKSEEIEFESKEVLRLLGYNT